MCQTESNKPVGFHLLAPPPGDDGGKRLIKDSCTLGPEAKPGLPASGET